jgi:hypothetical protein
VANYNLQPHEVVLLKEDNVAHGGTFSSHTDELILTNLNLVLIKKGLFGNRKGVLVFPVNQIKVHEGGAQALLGKTTRGTAALEVYFLNGQESFAFQGGGKRKILTWTTRINQAVTGTEAPDDDATLAIPGAAVVAGVLKDTVSVFRSRMGSGSAPSAQVAAKCTGCGASISATRGSTVACAYCGTTQQV